MEHDHDIRGPEASHRGSRFVTFNLDLGDTLPLLHNALDSYARLLESQSAEQHEQGSEEYARNLDGTAQEARSLLEAVIRASENA